MKCTVAPRLCTEPVTRAARFGGRRGGFGAGIKALATVLVSAILAATSPVAAKEPERLADLHAQDMRLARIADDLLTANADLCRQTMPVTGMILHSRDQYGGGGDAAFANGAVAIAGIVPDSAAEAAGLHEGDGILSAGDSDLRGLQRTGEEPVRDAVFDVIASQPSDAPLELLIARGGSEFAAMLHPQPGCRALVEVLSSGKRTARSNGRVIQISYGLAEAMSDNALATIFAHELAHSVLEHRRRLSEAGVSKGFLGEIGGNRRRNRQVETEADLLSVHLLANAGYDPRIAPEFWRSREGRSVDAGLFRSTIYASPSKRAEALEAEIETYLVERNGFSRPEHLLERRDTPF